MRAWSQARGQMEVVLLDSLNMPLLGVSSAQLWEHVLAYRDRRMRKGKRVSMYRMLLFHQQVRVQAWRIRQVRVQRGRLTCSASSVRFDPHMRAMLCRCRILCTARCC